jgi:hypothetical protein
MNLPLITIGNVFGTVAEHVNLMRDEGQSDHCIDYFIGHAIGRALDGEKPGPAAVPMSAYREHMETISTGAVSPEARCPYCDTCNLIDIDDGLYECQMCGNFVHESELT